MLEPGEPKMTIAPSVASVIVFPCKTALRQDKDTPSALSILPISLAARDADRKDRPLTRRVHARRSQHFRRRLHELCKVIHDAVVLERRVGRNAGRTDLVIEDLGAFARVLVALCEHKPSAYVHARVGQVLRTSDVTC